MNCTIAKTFKYHAFVVGSMLLMFAASSRAALIVDDSWADGGRNNGADTLDTDWWTSTGSTAIEVSVGSLGLVTGSSGRGIHGTFTPQTLSVGQTLTAIFTFTTPATVATNSQAAFRIGLFDTLGKAGLAADLTASSGSPNHIYDDLPGYMMDYDVNFSPSNIQFREHNTVAPPGGSGQLMSSTSDYTSLLAGGSTYSIAANTSYTGTFAVTKTALGLDLTGSLSQGSTLLSTFTTSDTTPSSSTYGMLAFQANSNIFGSSNTPGTANNGIDFRLLAQTFARRMQWSLSQTDSVMGTVIMTAQLRRTIRISTTTALSMTQRRMRR